jgi:hypothetical protein
MHAVCSRFALLQPCIVARGAHHIPLSRATVAAAFAGEKIAQSPNSRGRSFGDLLLSGDRSPSARESCHLPPDRGSLMYGNVIEGTDAMLSAAALRHSIGAPARDAWAT